MRNRWLRRALVGLVLVFPLLIGAVSSRSLGRFTRELRAGSPIIAVELVLVGGLAFAGHQRGRLLHEIQAVRSNPTWIGGQPSAALRGPRLALKTTDLRPSVRR